LPYDRAIDAARGTPFSARTRKWLIEIWYGEELTG
jgi:hypothetical protein